MAVTVALAGSTTAQAASVQSGSVEVDGLPIAVDLACTITCPPDAVTATSAGSISGVSNTATPFTVTWAAPPIGGTNLSGTIYYSSGCLQSAVWRGATIVGGSFVTISGATLVYGTATGTQGVPAAVTLYFGGTIAPGLFVPMTNEVVISGGPYNIDIPFLTIPGSLPTVPTSVPTLCVGTQSFTASGTFLTFGETSP